MYLKIRNTACGKFFSSSFFILDLLMETTYQFTAIYYMYIQEDLFKYCHHKNIEYPVGAIHSNRL